MTTIAKIVENGIFGEEDNNKIFFKFNALYFGENYELIADLIDLSALKDPVKINQIYNQPRNNKLVNLSFEIKQSDIAIKIDTNLYGVKRNKFDGETDLKNGLKIIETIYHRLNEVSKTLRRPRSIMWADDRFMVPVSFHDWNQIQVTGPKVAWD